MSYRPQVVKRGSRHIPWPYLALGLSLLIGSGWLLFDQFFSSDSALKEAPFSLCSLDLASSQRKLENLEIGKSLEIQDYLIYGETLNLYQNPYVLGQVDPFVGKTLVLKNLCDGYEWVYMLEKTVDGQIPLELLPVGFYEIFIVEDLERKRLYSLDNIHELFIPVRREGQTKTIEIIANQHLGVNLEETPLLDQAYVFIQVSQSNDNVYDDVVDVVIDPAHSTHNNGMIEKGRSAYSMIEANETLRMAVALKEELESYGLKVLLTRDDTEEVIDLYGSEGRLEKAYLSQAKYYIELNMNYSTNADLRGSRMTYSSYASNKFATSVFKAYLQDSELVAFGNASRSNIAGVVSASRYEMWDAIPVIRETGGRILSAGTLSELARTQNSSFNAEERFGMQAISLDLMYLSNEMDANLFSSRMKTWAQNIASGIANYLDVEKKS